LGYPTLATLKFDTDTEPIRADTERIDDNGFSPTGTAVGYLSLKIFWRKL